MALVYLSVSFLKGGHPVRILMLGAPGAGKGTQAVRIAASYGIPQISSGDIFRKNIKEGTALGKKAKQYIDAGELVPDELTVSLVISRLLESDCKNGYVLDGFPRTIVQAEALKKGLSEHGAKLDYVLDIEVPDDPIIERSAGRRVCKGCGATFHVKYHAPRKEGVCDDCGEALVIRADDAPETVKVRLKVYHEKTEPLISYYREEGILHMIDGLKSEEAVFSEIKAILEAIPL